MTAGALLLCTVVGVVTTLEFNTVLGRTDAFAAERLLDFPTLGAKSLIAPAVHLVVAFVLANVLLLLSRILSRLVPALHARVLERRRRLLTRLRAAGLADPTTAGQAVCVAGLAALIMVVISFSPLFTAYTARADDAPAADLALLAPENRKQHTQMRVALSGVLVLLLSGLWHVRRVHVEHVRLATGGGPTGAWPATASIVALTGVVILLQTVPWRLVWQSTLPQVLLEGRRCFVTGEHPDNLLVHCPGDDVPRNRVVRRGDPRLEHSGAVRPVFEDYARIASSTAPP